MKMERVSRWAEIVANVGVLVSLLILVAEVRGNTQVIQREAFLARSAAINAPFLENDRLARILAQVKVVDGWEGSPFEEAFAERYGLPIEDAIVWGRLVATIWTGIEADFVTEGRSVALESRVRLMLSFPDGRMGFELNPQISDPGFMRYVEEVDGATQ